MAGEERVVVWLVCLCMVLEATSESAEPHINLLSHKSSGLEDASSTNPSSASLDKEPNSRERVLDTDKHLYSLSKDENIMSDKWGGDSEDTADSRREGTVEGTNWHGAAEGAWRGRATQGSNRGDGIKDSLKRKKRRARVGGRVEEGVEIVLEGGSARGTGNVLVRQGGRLWTVCDDGWSLQAAQVVCRNLGYTGALGHTTRSYFGRPDHDIGLDNVQCLGDEESIMDCRHERFGVHNCNKGEAAGVFCAPTLRPSTVTTPRTTTRATRRPSTARSSVARALSDDDGVLLDEAMFRDNQVYQDSTHLRVQQHVHKPNRYEVRLVNGRSLKEGRVEVLMGGVRGVICADHWTLLEARVVCRQAGLGHAQSALQANFFGGEHELKLASGIRCEGEESELSQCYHEMSGRGSTCPRDLLVAGVVCTNALPDLVPNATLLASTAYLHDQPLYFMQCAMEENCAAPSAFDIRKTRRDWHVFRRRLLRFSSSVWNFGTADFRPGLRKEDWEWHLCHMHYHSMQIFAHYDIFDAEGNRVAEGHKASFCLEDVQCVPKVKKKYSCKGFGDQGISVGCADDYLHDIDCQWIDITDVTPGRYVFKVSVNPNYEIAELQYNNNAAVCDLEYSGVHVKLTNCVLTNP